MPTYIIFKLDGPDWEPVAEIGADSLDTAVKKLETEPVGRYRVVEVAKNERVTVTLRTVAEIDADG